jgi:hypothetical protein
MLTTELTDQRAAWQPCQSGVDAPTAPPGRSTSTSSLGCGADEDPSVIGAALATLSLLLASPASAEQFTRKSFVLPEGSFELTGDPARPAMAGVSLQQEPIGRADLDSPAFLLGRFR